MDFATPYDFSAAGCARETLDVRFSYYSPEEIRKVSVKQVTSVETFGEVGCIPTRSGLHADELGPAETDERRNIPCPTCGLVKDCPGHLGHIDLACPCYNPFLFIELFKLLRRTCLSCGRLKAKAEKTERVVRILMSLSPTELAQSAMLPTPSIKQPLLSDQGPEESTLWFEEDSSAGTCGFCRTESKDMNQQMNAATQVAEQCVEAMAAASEERLKPQDGQANFRESSRLESFRKVLAEYISEIPSHCANCGAKSAKWRKDGFSKLFVRRVADSEDMFCLPLYVQNVLKELWDNERAMLHWMIPGSVEHGYQIFFLECMIVPPSRFRPPMHSENSKAPSLHNQTSQLREVLVFNERMRMALSKGGKDAEEDPSKKRMMGGKPEDRPIQSAVQEFQGLQEAVNKFLDSSKSSENAKLAKPGVRQILEKKEGMFRMKMMGKRVNFAARSVISPDPNIETTEIGVPQMIAEVLTYPEVANTHNAERLRQLILRGPKYPGAVEVHIPKPNGAKLIKDLGKMSEGDREALSKQLLTDLDSGGAPMTVMRQIQDGDPLLVNRQPTLHKPGIMAHKAKIMSGTEKTIRLHYANCNTYNADFDGDEMNLHAPQDPIGRIEALAIAGADKQYLVPTSGKPLRGLIQDHVIGGVMLTRRDCYLSKSEACHLLYTGLRAALEGGDLAASADKSKKAQRGEMDILRHSQKIRVRLDQPSILKPRKLWSGKQVLTMLLKNLFLLCRKGRGGKDAKGSGMNFSSKSKTPGDMWNGKLDGDKEESTVILQGTELLLGVLDKNQFGASGFGLIHMIFEVLGSKAVGMVLASFARLFSAFLQMRGFTCAFADLVLKDPTEEERKALIANSRRVAQQTIRDWLSNNDIAIPNGEKATSQELANAGRGLIEANRESADALEASMLGRMRQSWTNTIDACIPSGQRLAFPKNCFSSMVQTGAKGSKVNQSMIACLLGQQELEGRQVPLMPTRRSLPCFAPYDLSSRTRGYITDRFLTGIRPPEFFFHCMSGREGLVDTAVKTSRSGYLQRCLVKHLECLKVCYDLTVRDSDGTVIQFLYGDDGADVTLSTHLFKFDALLSNFKLLRAGGEQGLAELRRAASGPASRRLAELEAAPGYLGAQRAALDGNLKSAAKQLKAVESRSEDFHLDPVARHSLRQTSERIHAARQQGDQISSGRSQDLFEPVSSVLTPSHFFGATSELHEAELQKYLTTALKSGTCSKEEADAFAQFMRLKFMQSLAHPGEAVGVIAAQSMGEPSTQMTLNTFHLAGHGGANVTLGIPRLREIVQTASKTPSTPLMKIEVLANLQGSKDLKDRRRFAGQLAARFRRVTLLDIVKQIRVDERVRMIGEELARSYHCSFEFWPIKELEIAIPHLTRERIEEYMSSRFPRLLKARIQRMVAEVKKEDPKKSRVKRGADEGGEAAAAADDEDDGGEAKKKRRLAMGRGQRDGDDQEEIIAAEEAQQDGAASEESAASGMYDEEDDEDLDKKSVDSDKDEGDKEALAGEGQAKDAAAAEDELVEEIFGEGASAPSGGTAPTKGAAKASKGAKTPKLDQLFQTAAASGSLVWSGKLESNDSISLVVTLQIASCSQKLLVGEIVRTLAQKAEFQDPQAAGVSKVHVQEDKGKIWLECEGTNLQALQSLPENTVDMQRMSSNDIAMILETFGVEACRANIIKEIRGVFGHYGIEVNHRHLSLIADFMTQAGGFKPFNRRGMLNHMSPFLQMSFETTMQFCQAACQDRLTDTMNSPASAIVVGQPAPVGTGMVSLMVDLEDEGPLKKKAKRVTPEKFF